MGWSEKIGHDLHVKLKKDKDGKVMSYKNDPNRANVPFNLFVGVSSSLPRLQRAVTRQLVIYDVVV